MFDALSERLGSIFEKLRGRGEFDFGTGAVLEDTSYDNRPHPKIAGHTERVQVIRIKFADGSTEDFNDKDKPAEIGGGTPGHE